MLIGSSLDMLILRRNHPVFAGWIFHDSFFTDGANVPSFRHWFTADNTAVNHKFTPSSVHHWSRSKLDIAQSLTHQGVAVAIAKPSLNYYPVHRRWYRWASMAVALSVESRNRVLSGSTLLSRHPSLSVWKST